MSNYKLVVPAVVALMALMLGLKWFNDRNAPRGLDSQPSTGSVQQPGEQAGEPQPEQQAPPPEWVSSQQAQPVQQAPVKYVPPPPDIIGPPNMTREKCLATYSDFPSFVAGYAQMLGTSLVTDYALCHAAAEKQDGFCSYATNDTERCMTRTANYLMVYTAATGSIDQQYCQRAMTFSKTAPKNVPLDKVCLGIEKMVKASVKGGRGVDNFSAASFCTGLVGPALQDCRRQTANVRADSRWNDYMSYLNGAGACEGKGGIARQDCLLIADMLAGVKSGKGKLWLYEALTSQNCKKQDRELVDAYCSGKLVPRGIEPEKPAGQGGEAQAGGE